LAVCWAAWWTFFGLASGLGEGGGISATLLHTAVPGGLFAALCLVAWRYERAGGVLLVLAGILSAVAFRVRLTQEAWFLLLTLVLPPVVAGVLLLIKTGPGSAMARPKV